MKRSRSQGQEPTEETEHKRVKLDVPLKADEEVDDCVPALKALGEEVDDKLPALKALDEEMDGEVSLQTSSLESAVPDKIRKALGRLLTLLITVVPETDLKGTITSDTNKGKTIAEGLTAGQLIELRDAFLERNWRYILNIRKLLPDR
jgi:hypothetical protein